MGIFGSKQQGDLQDGASQPAEQVHPVNTDGVLPGSTQAVTPTAQTVPTTGNDAGNYIVTDPPVQAVPVSSPAPVTVDLPVEDSQSVSVSTAAVDPPANEPLPDTVPEPQVTTQEFEQTAPEVTVTPLPVAPEVDPRSVSSPEPSLAGDLNTIKQQALTELSPIVDHLDQSPEDKFNTTMMLLQSTDDKNLIKTAYDCAKQITDEKVRARALLDIVNEINYFTQNKS